MTAIFMHTMGRRTADVPLSQLDDILLAADTPYRKLWYGSVLARTIGIAVLKYRSDHQITQAALGKLVGMTQPQVARIEDGEHNPALETMTRLCDTLGLELTLTIGPKQTERRVVPKTLQRGVHDATDQVVVSVRER
ncbi:MAG: helix-turn-helix transcriptional regulator [Thermoleophilia bacterium]|nr:helix-turn-helix transcriptional regulator [Thermoleophilia bacterium]